MAAPSQDTLKALEQSRQRLVQLTHSLGSLINSLNTHDPLPPWPSLQTQTNIISSNLQTLSTHLSENQDLFNSVIAYPAPNYPTKTHANTLEQILRTKLDPRVEEWVSRGREGADFESGSGETGAVGDGEGGGLSEGQLAELWEWAPVEANAEARRRDWGGDFTLEEREGGFEGVVTGLRRRLDVGDEEDEDEDEEEGMEREREEETRREPPSISLDDTLRFMTTGVLPQQR